MPRERRCCWLLWAATAGFMLLLGLCTLTELDLWLAARFYRSELPHAWFLAETLPWYWLYRYGETLALVMVAGALLGLLGSLIWRAWARYWRHCVLLVLVVALGPGLLVNGILKPGWGRPRPRQIEQFGGSQAYRPWWQPGGPGAGKSLPSGHAAMGYALVAAAALVPCRRLWLHSLALVCALGYGTLMGLARIVQGGHFASDVVWSGGLVCLTVLGLRVWLWRHPQAKGVGGQVMVC